MLQATVRALHGVGKRCIEPKTVLSWAMGKLTKITTWRHIAILCLGSVAVAAAPLARADVDAFLTDMEAAGYSNGDGNGAEITVGRTICEQVAGGISPSAVAENLWQNSKMDQAGSVQFVNIALRDLCPRLMNGDN